MLSLSQLHHSIKQIKKFSIILSNNEILRIFELLLEKNKIQKSIIHLDYNNIF